MDTKTMGWEKGAAFAQCFLMGQFGALSAITWITNDMKQKHDTQIQDLKQMLEQQSAELKQIRDKRWPW